MTITRDETRYGEAFLTRQSSTYLVVCKRFSTFPSRKSFFYLRRLQIKLKNIVMPLEHETVVLSQNDFVEFNEYSVNKI